AKISQGLLSAWRSAHRSRRVGKSHSGLRSGAEARPHDPEIYSSRGVAERRLGKNDLAVKDYTESNRLNSKNAEVYSNRANAYSLLGKYDEALKDYDQAIKLDPKNARIYANRGVISLRQGKTEDAEKDFKKAVELDPSLKQKIEP